MESGIRSSDEGLPTILDIEWSLDVNISNTSLELPSKNNQEKSMDEKNQDISKRPTHILEPIVILKLLIGYENCQHEKPVWTSIECTLEKFHELRRSTSDCLLHLIKNDHN